MIIDKWLLVVGWLLSPSMALLSVSSVQAEELRLSRMILGGEAVLTADTSRLAGAIGSFTWNGVEFIDQTDHGRELQSAVALDGLGECYNPTEAGSGADGRGGKTSSRIITAGVTNGILKTEVDAAFWLKPGTLRPKGCAWGKRPELKVTVNTAVTGGYLIAKTVKFGLDDIANSLDYRVRFTLPVAHKQARFEILTAYMPISFESLYSYHADEGRLMEEPPKPWQQLNGPPVLSTLDGRYAFGLVCKQPGKDESLEYWAWRNETAKVVKWACFSTLENPTAGERAYAAAVIFGDLKNVEAGIRAASIIRQP